MDPRLFSLSKGPSWIDYTVTPPAWDVDLEFCLSEQHNFLRKGDEGCFFFPYSLHSGGESTAGRGKMQGSKSLQ